MLCRVSQEEEIETIKLRNYNLNLSDADVERLAKKALSYGVTVAELLENFIGDLVDGTYSNGSDERMYASEWAERCWFAIEQPEKNLTMFFFDNNLTVKFGYSYDDFVNIIERIDDAKKSIHKSNKEISNPEEDWAGLVHWDHEKQEYVQSYANVDEYIENEKECLRSYKEELEEAEQELQELRDSFDSYMDGKEYLWEKQLEDCQKWYQDNIVNLLETSENSEEKVPVQAATHNNGGR